MVDLGDGDWKILKPDALAMKAEEQINLKTRFIIEKYNVLFEMQKTTRNKKKRCFLSAFALVNHHEKGGQVEMMII